MPVSAAKSSHRSRLSSPRSRNQVPPLKPLRNVQTMDPQERAFLEAAGQGDKPTILSFLESDNRVNINATDVLGRTALEIAVDNENIEIVEILLNQPNIKIGNALLHAVREGVYRIVEVLINHSSITPEMLGEGWKDALSSQDAENFEYSADISPVILAAHLNRFEILQLLLSRGVTIHRPHNLSCSCATCEEERTDDSLKHSLRRIYTYRALASPAWISLTSNDPILSAFKLSWELQKLSRKECEFKDVYLHLNEQCKSYACDLLTQCRSTEEVIAILNKDSMPESPDDIWASKLSLERLKLAIKYEQKQFVAHPHCQQLLTSIWFEGIPGRQERGSLVNKFICLLLILAWPFLSLAYIILPRSQVGQVVRSPFMKFLYFSTSFGCFLCLLTMATFEDYRLQKGDANGRSAERGPSPTCIETLISIWVFGMVWSEVKQLWEEGFKKYIHQWWNWLDYIMVSLYISTFMLRLVAYKLVRDSEHGSPIMPRNEWHADEPLLISESLFAVANVFSFARIIYLFQTNPYLGPLQISLGCMLIDIGKFFVIFFLVLTSFAIGLAQLYWYYTVSDCDETDGGCKKNSDAFSSIANSYTTLLWSLFSITKTEDTEVVENHDFTQLIGRGMYIAYHVTSIIVLLNMLIAMMSHSFQTINDHADLEWKFHRTKLWMSYFDEGSSLPAPFNIIITPKSLYYLVKNVICILLFLCGRSYDWPTKNKRATIKRPGGRRKKKTSGVSESGEEVKLPEPLTYQDIMRRLVSRYIHQTEKDMKMDGVNEDDLLEIKQDISSLRFELREDRRREVARSSNHIDGVKHEILRSLSSVGPRPSYLPTPEKDLASGMSDDLSEGILNEEPADRQMVPQSRTPSIELNQAHANYIRRRFPMLQHQSSYLTSKDLDKAKSEIINVINLKLEKHFFDITENLKNSFPK